MKYKVGDKVRVKSLEELQRYYPRTITGSIHGPINTVTKNMQKLCGTIVTIDTVNRICYSIKEYTCSWYDWMFENILYTIEDFKNGKVICEMDGTLEEKKAVLLAAYSRTESTYLISERVKYYWTKNHYHWCNTNNIDNENLPVQSVKLFYKQLNQQTMSDQITILKKDFKELYDAACSTWKEKFNQQLAQDPFGDTISFSQDSLKIMRKACTMDQLVIFSKLFPICKVTNMKQWSDLGRIGGYFVTDNATVSRYQEVSNIATNKNVFATKEQALSSLAMSQLSQLLKDLGNECDVDWSNPDLIKYTIGNHSNEIKGCTTYNNYYFLAFRTEKIRDEFMNTHMELIRQYFML